MAKSCVSFKHWNVVLLYLVHFLTKLMNESWMNHWLWYDSNSFCEFKNGVEIQLLLAEAMKVLLLSKRSLKWYTNSFHITESNSSVFLLSHQLHLQESSQMVWKRLLMAISLRAANFGELRNRGVDSCANWKPHPTFIINFYAHHRPILYLLAAIHRQTEWCQ